MVTGSRGIHVVCPLRRGPGFGDVHGFARALAEEMVRDDPRRLTLEWKKADRGERIYVDVNRIAYAQHAVAPYGVRARAEGARGDADPLGGAVGPPPEAGPLDDEERGRAPRRRGRPVEGHDAAGAEAAVTAPFRQLGGTPVFPIGLGTMPLSVPGRPDEQQSIRTIRAALDAGVNLLDTADAYSFGEDDVGAGERLIARALADVPAADRPLVATKGGHTRPDGRWELDGSPGYLRAACEASLRALETDRIDLYQLHRPDPDTPFAESVGALRDLRDEGKIRLVGLSNVTVAQLEEAEAIVEIAAVQNELSLEYVGPLDKGEVAACAERGIPFLAWSPLGGASGAGSQTPAVARVAAKRGACPRSGWRSRGCCHCRPRWCRSRGRGGRRRSSTRWPPRSSS